MPLDPGRDFRVTAVRLKAAEEALVPAVRRNIRVAVAPLGEAVRQSALDLLPKSGGANEWVAASQITVSTSFIPKAAGVTLRMSNKSAAVQAKRARARAAGKSYRGSPSHNLQAINKGVLRHPVFGNRDVWRTTAVPIGFFDRPVHAARPAVQAAAMAALVEAARVAGFR